MLENILKYLAIAIYCFLFFIFGIFSRNSQILHKIISSVTIERESSLYGDYDKEFAKDITVWVDDQDKVHNDLILIATHFIDNPGLILVNNLGEIVHSWNIQKDIVNPELKKVHDIDLEPEDTVQAVVDAHLFPNGDVIVTNDLREFDNYRGISMMRLDKDSKVIWQIIDEFHHDFNIDENGIIYALDFDLSTDFPLIDFTDSNANIAYMNDMINIIDSSDGKILDKISITEAFADSEYSYFLTSFVLEKNHTFQQFKFKDGTDVFDILHTNSVQYISSDLANNSIFEAGDLLISMRGLDAVAVIRPSLKKVVWAKTGPWRNQHYARLNQDGNIYIYDNDGSGTVVSKGDKITISRAPRILSYNSKNDKINIVYYNPTYPESYSYWRGYFKKLKDDSFIISSSAQSRILQVDNDGSVIWELRAVTDRDVDNIPYLRRLVSVRHYYSDYVKF